MKLGTWCLCAVAMIGLLVSGCGDDDNPAIPGGISSFDQQFGWDCTTSETCQDVFNIQFAAGSIVTFRATQTTGGSVLQVALYGPGVGLGGTNLFTLDSMERRCDFVSGCGNNTTGQLVADFVIPTAGVYRLAITRDWDNSCGGSGTYRLLIDSDKAFSTPSQTLDDAPSLASGWRCPLSYDEVHGWTCATSESCQDVFNIQFASGATVSFQATETTGGSVLQIALYGPGVALGGNNLFTSTTNELRCNFVTGCLNNTTGQTVSDFVIPTAGVYRLAVTRDWDNSCGGSGTYRLIIDSEQPFSQPILTVDNVASLAPGWECP